MASDHVSLHITPASLMLSLPAYLLLGPAAISAAFAVAMLVATLKVTLSPLPGFKLLSCTIVACLQIMCAHDDSNHCACPVEVCAVRVLVSANWLVSNGPNSSC